MLKIKREKPTNLIETFIRSCHGSLIYHSGEYLNLVGSLLNADAYYLVAYEGESICGVIPFMVKTGKLGKVFNSMAYYGSNGGVLQFEHDPNTKRALLKEFYELAQREGAVSATIITNPFVDDAAFLESVIKFDYRDKRVGQITHLDICEKPEQLIDCFDSPRPRNIRKAQKSGVSVFDSQSQEALDFLYRTHVDNMRAIGGLAKDKLFFDLVAEQLDKRMWNVYLASVEGEFVAALLLLYYGNTVEYFTPVIQHEYRNSQALALLIFEAMKQAKAEGYVNWNWGGTWLSQSGVYNFKKKWATKDYPYFYYTKSFSETLKKSSRTDLLEQYPGMFVLPFSELEY